MKTYGYFNKLYTKQIIGIIAVLFALVVILMLAGIASPDNQAYANIFSIAIMLIMTYCNTHHFSYLSPKTAGYKYFHSLPDAYEKYRKHCIKMHIISFALGGLSLLWLALYGFKNAGLISTVTLYMLSFGIQNLMCANRSKMKKPNGTITGVSYAILGGTIGLYKLFFEDVTANPIVGIVLSIISVTFALVSLIPFYKKLRFNWNNTEERN